MRASKLHLISYRDDPSDAEVLSHKLMVRAGFIYKISSGLYVYSPLMWRSLQKAKRIIRDELDAVGCLETQFPILQDQSLWERSGRWDIYRATGTMFTTTDRRSTCYGLAPTAEEVVTDYVKATVKSYKQLPATFYQIHTKFRDELRPRFGLLRVKEFIMKDAYSFDIDEEALDRSFELMKAAYYRIFSQMGLEAFGVDADSGDIGGSGSMEFMLAAEAGEDAILIEESSAYAANVEKAVSRLAPSSCEDQPPQPMTLTATPNVKTCDQLHAFFPQIPMDQMVKTIVFKATYAESESLVAALIRGDQEINEIKLRNHLGCVELRLLTNDEIASHTGAPQGYAGPIGLNDAFAVVADLSVKPMKNILCGANQVDVHALNANLGVDFPAPEFADFRTAREGEPGPIEGQPLTLKRGIEVGHIFKLGSKYSAAMDATFMNKNGRKAPFLMGCYGIGVSRVIAAAIEQKSDERGIVWPLALAPFQIVVANLMHKKADISAEAEAIYDALKEAGADVLFEDRPLSPGAKLKDMELMGFPVVIVVGRDVIKDGTVELRTRANGETLVMSPAEAIAGALAYVSQA